MSPIKLRHVSLTHPQTPINRSLPKTFRRTKIQKDQDSEVKKLCWNQALKPPGTSRTSTPKSENIRSRIIQTICLDPKVCRNQAQRSENIIKSQISEALRIQASKAPKNFHHKPSNTKNIRSRIIQTICLDPKVCGNQAQRFENINKSQISEALRIQASKAPKNFTTNPQIRRTFEEESSKSSS